MPRKNATSRKRKFGTSSPRRKPEPSDSAKAAALRYVTDSESGFYRRRCGSGFCYVTDSGKPVKDRRALDRIQSLVIPPAWRNVWVCATATGHLQAVGWDTRGRKQYRYHPRWRAIRDQTKFDRLSLFAKALPRLRRRVSRDLKLPGLPRQKVLATLVKLLEATLIRVGNEEYSRENGSFGLTTLQNRHARVRGEKIEFRFRGKGGIFHSIEIHNRRLIPLLKRIQGLPGQELFQYLTEDGHPHRIDSADLNDYLRDITGEDFTAKDFRTWAATLMAARILMKDQAPPTQTARRRMIVATVRRVAEQLRNTVAVCRKSYIHPIILERYLEGNFLLPTSAGVSSKGRMEKYMLRCLRPSGRVARNSA